MRGGTQVQAQTHSFPWEGLEFRADSSWARTYSAVSLEQRPAGRGGGARTWERGGANVWMSPPHSPLGLRPWTQVRELLVP